MGFQFDLAFQSVRKSVRNIQFCFFLFFGSTPFRSLVGGRGNIYRLIWHLYILALMIGGQGRNDEGGLTKGWTGCTESFARFAR